MLYFTLVWHFGSGMQKIFSWCYMIVRSFCSTPWDSDNRAELRWPRRRDGVDQKWHKGLLLWFQVLGVPALYTWINNNSIVNHITSLKHFISTEAQNLGERVPEFACMPCVESPLTLFLNRLTDRTPKSLKFWGKPIEQLLWIFLEAAQRGASLPLISDYYRAWFWTIPLPSKSHWFKERLPVNTVSPEAFRSPNVHAYYLPGTSLGPGFASSISYYPVCIPVPLVLYKYCWNEKKCLWSLALAPFFPGH